MITRWTGKVVNNRVGVHCVETLQYSLYLMISGLFYLA